MNATNVGIDWSEERQDYIGNEYGKGFWEEVYVPSDYNGEYPNGDKIQSGVTFSDIRSWYKNDPQWVKVSDAKESGNAPVLIYHRFFISTREQKYCVYLFVTLLR